MAHPAITSTMERKAIFNNLRLFSLEHIHRYTVNEHIANDATDNHYIKP